MKTNLDNDMQNVELRSQAIAFTRIISGLVWAIDAFFKWIKLVGINPLFPVKNLIQNG